MVDLFSNNSNTEHDKMKVFDIFNDIVLKDIYIGFLTEREVLINASEDLNIGDIITAFGTFLDRLETEQKDYILDKLNLLKGLPKNALVNTTIAEELRAD